MYGYILNKLFKFQILNKLLFLYEVIKNNIFPRTNTVNRLECCGLSSCTQHNLLNVSPNKWKIASVYKESEKGRGRKEKK